MYNTGKDNYPKEENMNYKEKVFWVLMVALTIYVVQHASATYHFSQPVSALLLVYCVIVLFLMLITAMEHKIKEAKMDAHLLHMEMLKELHGVLDRNAKRREKNHESFIKQADEAIAESEKERRKRAEMRMLETLDEKHSPMN